MSLIICPFCSNEVSDSASVCPKCGHRSNEFNEKLKQIEKANAGKEKFERAYAKLLSDIDAFNEVKKQYNIHFLISCEPYTYIEKDCKTKHRLLSPKDIVDASMDTYKYLGKKYCFAYGGSNNEDKTLSIFLRNEGYATLFMNNICLNDFKGYNRYGTSSNVRDSLLWDLYRDDHRKILSQFEKDLTLGVAIECLEGYLYKTTNFLDGFELKCVEMSQESEGATACPECGREMPGIEAFCPHCGYPLIKDVRFEQTICDSYNSKRSYIREFSSKKKEWCISKLAVLGYNEKIGNDYIRRIDNELSNKQNWAYRFHVASSEPNFIPDQYEWLGKQVTINELWHSKEDARYDDGVTLCRIEFSQLGYASLRNSTTIRCDIIKEVYPAVNCSWFDDKVSYYCDMTVQDAVEFIKKICKIEWVDTINNRKYRYGISTYRSDLGSDTTVYAKIEDTIRRHAFPYRTKKLIIPEGVKHVELLDLPELEEIDLPESLEDINLDNCESLKYVELPKNLKKVSFENCKSLVDIKLPKNLNEVSFKNCKSLVEVAIPEGVSKIDEPCFDGCVMLKSISLPKSLQSIGHSVFEECANLCTIIVPEKVKVIEYHAFEKCTSLKSVKLNDKLESLEWFAFAECTDLEHINLTPNLKKISKATFLGCKSLKEIEIPPSIEKLDKESFNNCTSLSEIKINLSDCIIIEITAFSGCNELNAIQFFGLGEIEFFEADLSSSIRNGKCSITEKSAKLQEYLNNCALAPVINRDGSAWYFGSCLVHYSLEAEGKALANLGTTIIANEAFDQCKLIERVELPEGVTTIGSRAFRDCVNLKEITIPSTLRYIGDDCFEGCDKLKRITLPKHIEHIGTNNEKYLN